MFKFKRFTTKNGIARVSQKDQSLFCLDCQKLRFDPRRAVGTDEDGYQQRLHYKRKDWFPRLPSLGSSATKGCKLCEFLTEVIRKHVIDNFDPNIPAMEVELTLLTMQVETRRDDNNQIPGYITGQITAGNITKSLRINVQDDKGACSKSLVSNIGG